MAPSVRLAVFVLACAAALGTSAGAAPTDPPPLTPVTTPSHGVGPTVRHWVPTRHGAIAVDLTLPILSLGERVPVIMRATPYAVLDATTDTTWVRRGYAFAVAQVLGTADSGGCWDYGGKRERESIADVIEYLAGFALDGSSSPAAVWSSAKVGMIGASYDGTIANAAAVEAPPHLETIVPEVAISDWYSYAYHDGVRYFLMDPGQRQGLVVDEQGFDTPLAFDAVYGVVPTRNRDDGFALRLAERACPGVLDKIEHTARAYDLDPDFDAFWQERSYRLGGPVIAEAGISVLIEGGWRDYNVKHSESSRWFEAIPSDGDAFTMLVMGQQAHGAPDPEFSYGTLLHAWFDHFLYGYETGIRAQPRAWTMANDGVLRKDATWPPPGTEDVPLFLRADGSLSSSVPQLGEGTASYVDTGVTTESEALRARGGDTMLWFESAPLTQDIRIAGIPRLDLHASTLGTSTLFTPVLVDLGPPVSRSPSLCTFTPEAEACVISRGFLNARHRDGIEQGKDLSPGETYQATVRFLDNDWVVKAGHRIGVALMSSNVWWALPDQQRAVNTISLDGTAPSALVLPIVGGGTAATTGGLS